MTGKHLVALIVAPLILVGTALPAPAVTQLLNGLQVGNPVRHGGLTVFPLTSKASGSTRYLTLDKAIRKGDVKVQEKEGGTVSTVRVKNTSDRYVFGMAGEIITGAKQNRMLQRDVLLPPKSGWLDLSVYCVEQGRWHGASAEFGSKGQIAAGRIRGKAANTQSQSEVWAEVEANNEALGIVSSTRRYDAALDDHGVQDKIESYKKGLEKEVPKLAPNALGVAVAKGDRLVCVDVFGTCALFKKMWPRLLESYIIDAISQEPSGSMSKKEVAGFLRDGAQAKTVAQPAVGAGKLYRLEGDDATGQALVFGKEVVHLDLFPEDSESSPLRLDIRRQGLER